jgi:hypothetical protein
VVIFLRLSAQQQLLADLLKPVIENAIRLLGIADKYWGENLTKPHIEITQIA